MTWSKETIKVKNPEKNPIHILYLAAKQIIDIHNKAAEKAGKEVDGIDTNVELWMQDVPLMKITIQTGPAIEAEYAIFKAQTK